MNVKRFIEDDMRQAMARVREELGKDAVILSTRRVDGRTEITAALDYEAPASNAPGAAKLAAAAASLAAQAEEDDTPSLGEIQGELLRLRKLFEAELSQLAWREKCDRQPNQLALIHRLESVGMNREISQKIVEKVLPCSDIEIGWRRALHMIGKVVRITEDDLMAEGGIIALVGPTGVGKTTTAAKLAAHFALRHGRKQVAFITTDNFRVGGQEQLISYGSILGMPVQVANDADDMARTLSSLSERKLVLIDTAGMSQRDMALAEQLQTLAVEDFAVRPYLVLSAIAQECVVNETLKAFSGARLAGAIVTKTDEAGSLGPLLSGLIRHKLPTAFVGTGQRVPEDLARARPEYFVNQLSQLYEQLQEQPEQRPRKARQAVSA